MLVVLIIELLYHDLNQNVPFSQAKSKIKHEIFFVNILPYFNAWFRKFHEKLISDLTSIYMLRGNICIFNKSYVHKLFPNLLYFGDCASMVVNIVLLKYNCQHLCFWTISCIWLNIHKIFIVVIYILDSHLKLKVIDPKKFEFALSNVC